jgi:hypothetical protein
MRPPNLVYILKIQFITAKASLSARAFNSNQNYNDN